MSNVTYSDSEGRFVDHFTQWDVGQTLFVNGVETVGPPEFHFCNSKTKQALVVSSKIDGDSISAEIPDLLLQDATPITVHLYYQTGEDSAKTEHSVVIPVIPRQKPADYTYEEKRIGIPTILGIIYPVGAVYSSTNTTLPDEFLIGNWVSVGIMNFENDTVYMWKRIA